MKKTLTIVALLAGIFYACDTDDGLSESHNQADKKDENLVNQKSANINNESIIKDGKTYYSGFGYDPTSDICYDLPFSDSDAMQPTTYINEPLVKTIEIIKTHKQLESYVRRSKRSDAYEYALENGGEVDELAKRIRFSENTMTVAARISVKRYKYLASGFPFLVSDAYTMLDQGRINEFVNKYGPMYVDSQTLGGDVYYLYTFSDTSFNSSTVTEFENQIKASIDRLFNVENGTYISPSDRVRITNALISAGSYSSVVGFNPISEVKTVADFEAESERFMNYLNVNPDRAKTISLNLKRYFSLSGNQSVQQALDTAFFNRTQCFIDAMEWVFLRGDLRFIAENTNNESLRADANNAIAQVQANIENSMNCVNSTAPTGSEYSDIKTRYNLEKGL